ncbi:MAG: hypothetical protein KKD38_07850 [Candidatus Delongbacteria bacterium]|nr:hypothetical protein [Candidatus Delongbacteria bacterium]MCG2760832.1 hypothetical protein [Candidatus Delongbacteria bacterium]
MKTNNISKAQIEVWEWKEKAASEVENMDLKKALDVSISNSIKIMKKLGLKSTKQKDHKAGNLQLAVSDKHSEYNSDTEKNR